MKVFVGMSGGVDSSVCAYLLKERGMDAAGVTMRLADGSYAPADDANTADAKRVCDFLGIPHYTADFRADFREHVMDYFTAEYLRGATPNPCIECNKHLKFGAMLSWARENGADCIATGHYARVAEADGKYIIKKAVTAAKDQSYVLYTLTQEQLRRVILPLGEYTKDEIRAIAHRAGLPTANKPDSQDICFLPDGNYAEFVRERVKDKGQRAEGNFVDRNGNVLGRHKGTIHYTIGQRKGLGMGFGEKMFVVGIDALRNEVVLAAAGGEFGRELTADRCNWCAGVRPDNGEMLPFRCGAKIRYSGAEAACVVRVEDKGQRVKVVFDEPQRAITPGQSVVFYDGDIVLGGGIIK